MAAHRQSFTSYICALCRLRSGPLYRGIPLSSSLYQFFPLYRCDGWPQLHVLVAALKPWCRQFVDSISALLTDKIWTLDGFHSEPISRLRQTLWWWQWRHTVCKRGKGLECCKKRVHTLVLAPCRSLIVLTSWCLRFAGAIMEFEFSRYESLMEQLVLIAALIADPHEIVYLSMRR